MTAPFNLVLVYASPSFRSSQFNLPWLVLPDVVLDGGYPRYVSLIVNVLRMESCITDETLESAAFIGLNAFARTPLPRYEDPIQFLIETNQQAWEDLVNHPFPRQMARGTAPLNGFRHYMIVSGPNSASPRPIHPKS